jgi:hypothetical protein
MRQWVTHTSASANIRSLERRAKAKKPKRVLGNDDETPSPGQSPKYQESNDSSSATDSDNGRDGGSQYCIKLSRGGTQFTGDKYKLCYIVAPYFFKHY